MLAYTHTHTSIAHIDWPRKQAHTLSLTHFHTFTRTATTMKSKNNWHIRNPPLLGHGLWQQQKMREQRVWVKHVFENATSEKKDKWHIPSKNSCLTNWTTMHVLPTAKEPKVPSSIVSLFVDMMVIAYWWLVLIVICCCLLIVDWLIDWWLVVAVRVLFFRFLCWSWQLLTMISPIGY